MRKTAALPPPLPGLRRRRNRISHLPRARALDRGNLPDQRPPARRRPDYFIFLKRDAIVTPSQTLRLHAVSILLTHARVQKIQPLPYNKRAAGEAAALFIHVIRLTWHKRRRQLRPMQQIPAHRVTPAGLAPGEAKRVILIEKVIRVLVPDQAVRIVDPARAAHKMILLAHMHRMRALLLLQQLRKIRSVVRIWPLLTQLSGRGLQSPAAFPGSDRQNAHCSRRRG